MEKEIIMYLSEEDKEFLKEEVAKAVEERIALAKDEKYTEFQQTLLSMEITYFTKFITYFMNAYEKLQKKANDEIPSTIIAKYGKKDLIETLNKIKDEKELKEYFEKNIGEYQSGVFFEVYSLIKKIGIVNSEGGEQNV